MNSINKQLFTHRRHIYTKMLLKGSAIKASPKYTFYARKSIASVRQYLQSSQNARTVQTKLPKYLVSEVFVEEGKSILNMTVRFLPVFNIDGALSPPEGVRAAVDSRGGASYDDTQSFFYDMLNEASQQYTNRGIMALIQASPREIMTSKFCTTALSNIIRIHSNRIQRDPFAILIDTTEQNLSRNLYVHQLLDRLVEVGDPTDLLATIDLLITKRKFLEGAQFCRKLIDQVIMEVITGKYTLKQVITVVVFFTNYHEEPEFVNTDLRSLWFGIHLNEAEISDHDAILTLFKNLDAMPDVSDYVIALVDRMLLTHPIEFTFDDVRNIVVAMNNARSYSATLNILISKWFADNASAIKEKQFQEFLINYTRNRLQEHNASIERGLEAFVDVHKKQVKHPTLFALISQYLVKHRIKNPKLLNILSEILMNHVNRLQPKSVLEIFYVFGYLSYELPAEYQIKFWPVMEHYIDSNMFKIRATILVKLLEILLYMNNYTLKFVPKLRDPKFQSIVEYLDPEDFIQLQIYDISMAFEEPKYPGPMFKIQEKIKNIQVIPEPYVAHVVDRIEPCLAKVLKNNGLAYAKLLRLDFMPQSNLYIVDIFAYPERIQQVTQVSDYLRKHPFESLAILIRAPYHSQHNRAEELIGPQRLRRRHFYRMGIRIVEVDGLECLAMRFQPHLLEDYLDRLLSKRQVNKKVLES